MIALDRDGTIVPIARRPEDAVVSPELRKLIFDLAALPNLELAIVSARSLKQLEIDFGQGPFVLSGNYGLESRLGSGKPLLHPHALASRNEMMQVLAQLQELGGGLILEDHGLSLCAHYHLCSQAEISKLKELVENLSESTRNLKFHKRPTSFEVMPGFDWDKGKALDFICSALAESNGGANYGSYIYAGDSDGDEPAFAWVNARGGTSIRIDLNSRTAAAYRLDSPELLIGLLKTLL